MHLSAHLSAPGTGDAVATLPLAFFQVLQLLSGASEAEAVRSLTWSRMGSHGSTGVDVMLLDGQNH